ncbi:ERMES complex Ca(2+)-binding regulatory GTPase GEM1 [Pneumocystis jirovecii RU7]|uniref:Mitochondrial Rho GTPase n=1 Tax=Pneumocystis jirovecii (strain RU7) TaxID=1408657 RepID=A0A0W4ZQ46_PNEJ7|nr:ERMES complex Ca(2+)-binding regulatory GTPase GEM1 [Pneumocystis jirovecii RU7]KTW30509.1 hypothetical protein T551_01792 [Pneumocystis jirovecii RU7]
MTDIRIVVVGDDHVGKSSLITSLVKVFVQKQILADLIHVVPPVSVPDMYSNMNTIIVDTSSDPADRPMLIKELRKANVICLVYADSYSGERVSLFWLPFFRSLGVNLPVVLCANKCDNLEADGSLIIEEEMLPIMKEFKQVFLYLYNNCFRSSGKAHRNVNEVFYLCQRAVTHPIAPLFNAKEQELKPAAVVALKRIFFLSDKDHNGILNDVELDLLQRRCFEKPMAPSDFDDIKFSVSKLSLDAVRDNGLTEIGFLLLNKIFAVKGRHETTWQILRSFKYTDSLSLKDDFLNPKFEVGSNQSVELSPLGYRFLVDYFSLMDKDNDGALNSDELCALFAPTPGLPKLWLLSSFPESTVRNEMGYVTYNGWLAQWSMTTLLDYSTTLAYLAYLGFESIGKEGTMDALYITKARKRGKKSVKVDRNVFLCYVVGKRKSGKSCLLDSFINIPYNPKYTPTKNHRTVVNSVEIQSIQRYLVLEELTDNEHAVLSNPKKLDACDVLCLTYDSSDPESFGYLLKLQEKYPEINSIPCVYAATKADLDRQQQRCDIQPDQYTQIQCLRSPIHVSIPWMSTSDLFVQLVEAAQTPYFAIPRKKNKEKEPLNIPFLLATSAFGALVISVGAHLFFRKP